MNQARAIKRWLRVAVGLALVTVIVIVVTRSGGPGGSGSGSGSGSSATAGSTRSSKRRAATARRFRRTHWERYSPLSHAPDPVGSLRLEGQVIDAQSHGVAKAVVTINSSPPRTTTTEDDGSFVFEKLIARQYKLRARAGALVGGPIAYRLQAKSDPAIIRMRAGVALEVSVVAAKGKQPIAGALVAVDRREKRADARGKALFEGVGGGYVVLAARAKGYGARQRLFELAAGRRRLTAVIALSRGAAVSGVVKDAKGQPVAGAKVHAHDMSKVLQLGASALASTKSDDAGKFTLPGVARGTYRFIAYKHGYAPGRSAPIAVDGATERGGVTITLRAGATLAGRVLRADKSPAAGATVKVALASGTFGGVGRFRRAVTDKRGAFELRGMPRARVSALAYSASASSAAKRFDLRRGDVRDVTFELSVAGEIAGTVVDGAGQPVAEAHVSAVGDFWGGAKLSDIKLRGASQVTTDGAGGFRFRGLTPGKYRLRASRTVRFSSRFGPGGVSAKTGDTSVKIVLRADGGIKGALRLSSGGAAAAYTVSLGYPPALPVLADDGAFSMNNVRPGKYDVIFDGPGFVQKTVRNVEVSPGKVADLGTVTVETGRVIKGRVLDGKGQPVADAAVVLGKRIVGDGAHLSLEIGSSLDRSLELRRGASGPDGRYAIKAVGAGAFVVAAEHADHGRSGTMVIPAGKSDATLDLRLRPFGRVSGTVKLGSAPAANVAVVASGGSVKQAAAVRTSADGRYVFARLPAGKHKLTAMAGSGAGGGGLSTGSTDVVVVAGKDTRADIEIEIGEIDLTVRVLAKSGKIDATQVFLFSGVVKVSTGAQISTRFLAATKKGSAKMTMALGAKPASFSKLRPGQYSICAIPITGSMNDPLFARRLQAHAAKLAVYCRAQRVGKTPSKQSVTLALPPMKPLPAK